MGTLFLILVWVCMMTVAISIGFIRARNAGIWIGEYLKGAVRGKPERSGAVTHVLFCFVDHFEPRWNNAAYEQEARRVDAWIKEYPLVAARHKDCDGKNPAHTFFYPEEEYNPEHLEKLAGLCRDGFGEVEIHLHHDNDTDTVLREKINTFRDTLVRHGLLCRDRKGNARYGFIHGNWALDNSRKDGRMCGVNNELIILKETGCYADFTLPSAPSDTQTKKINSIYYAKDDPARPKSHNTGVDVAINKQSSGDLMIIQGPLCLNWKSRKWMLLPRIENAEVAPGVVPIEDKIGLWMRQSIIVKGRPEWIFVKVHTHGAQEETIDFFFKKNGLNRLFSCLENAYNDEKCFKLHYLSAREMYNIIKAAEAGEKGDPGAYRDYELVSSLPKVGT